MKNKLGLQFLNFYTFNSHQKWKPNFWTSFFGVLPPKVNLNSFLPCHFNLVFSKLKSKRYVSSIIKADKIQNHGLNVTTNPSILYFISDIRIQLIETLIDFSQLFDFTSILHELCLENALRTSSVEHRTSARFLEIIPGR